MNLDDLVSVVIPTRNRPALVVRAVHSALQQTYSKIEVIVVVDGPDEPSVEALKALGDYRVLVIALAKNVGGSEARNTGIRQACGEWIALLDDDDEWLPQKISRQMAALESLEDRNVILSCKYIERSMKDARTFPSRLPDPGERLDEYLCCPRGFSTKGEVLQTSTLLVPKHLMLTFPFVVGLQRGQDFMWLIRAGGAGNARLHIVPEVLSIFNADGFTDDRRVSTVPKWRSFYACVQDNRSNFTADAYAYCIATRILTDVLTAREGFLVKTALISRLMMTGTASLRCVFLFMYIWLVPRDARSRFGDTLRRIRGQSNIQTVQGGAA